MGIGWCQLCWCNVDLIANKKVSNLEWNRLFTILIAYNLPVLTSLASLTDAKEPDPSFELLFLGSWMNSKSESVKEGFSEREKLELIALDSRVVEIAELGR